jgi:uncharacterized SAM-binding protein YcdF (DUF218 family)
LLSTRLRWPPVSIYFVIFGAAVRADGAPSGSLARRVEGALALARDVPDRMFLATGGVGRHGPAEARVIRDLLVTAGIDPSEILLEDQASDTLQSVLFCHAILRLRDDAEVLTPCSSGYHNLRCALLFRMLGYQVRIGRMPPDLPHLGPRKWAAYVLKEFLALPCDAVLLLLRRAIMAGCPL